MGPAQPPLDIPPSPEFPLTKGGNLGLGVGQTSLSENFHLLVYRRWKHLSNASQAWCTGPVLHEGSLELRVCKALNSWLDGGTLWQAAEVPFYRSENRGSE